MGVLKGLAGVEDLEFGLGMAQRMEGFGTKGVRKQICAEDFPILDILGQYSATEVEAALAEARTEVIDGLYSAADALLAGGYISDRDDFIDQILSSAENAAAAVNAETEEGYTGGDTPAVTSTPGTAGLLTIMYPGMMQPAGAAILWVEAIGGVGPYTWSFDDNNSGASLTAQVDTTRVLFTAGAVEAADIIRVTDSNGLTATAQITVSTAAPDVVIYGPTTAVVDGPDQNYEATGGATPYTWAMQINLSGSSFVAGSGTNMSYTPGAVVGRDTIRVTESGGTVDLHDVDVQASSVIPTPPIILGDTGAEVETSVMLQCIGGKTPIDWEISDNQSGATLYVESLLFRLPFPPGLINPLPPLPVGDQRRAWYTAGVIAGVSDTITATDADGNTDTHSIAVTSASPVTQPKIYGYENCMVNSEILLQVYDGQPPYDWEIVTNESGSQLNEYENDEDGGNRFRAGGTASDYTYQGTWNADTNVPELVSSTGTEGDYRKVATAGTTDLDGISDWAVDDILLFTGGAWTRPEAIADNDVVRVTDENGNTAEHEIHIYGTSPDPIPPDPIYPPWPPIENDDVGYLSGNIAPQGAIDAGAKWRANGGDWMDSGEQLEGLAVGDKVTVNWRPVDDWSVPADEVVTIVAGANVASGNYEQSSDVISYFDVSVNLTDYFPGEVMRVTIIPRDSDGNRVYPETTNILIETVAEGIDLLAGTCQRADAATSVAAQIAGGGTYYKDLVWFGTGTLPDPLTITVKLTSDPTITGSTTVGLDATAEIVVSDSGAGTYVNEAKYEHIAVQMKNGDGADLPQWDGNVTLTPTGTGTPLISVDGAVYAASITIAVVNGSASTDIYLKDASGTVTITAASVDHVTLTDTLTLTESPVTFVFNYVWDPVNLKSLIKDSTNFTVQITAMQSGSVLTTFDEACTVSSSETSETGATINLGDWTLGVATLAALNVVFTGTPTTITLTCTDDATGLKSGTRYCQTTTAKVVSWEICALDKSMRAAAHPYAAASANDAFDAVVILYATSPAYETDGIYGVSSPPRTRIDANTIGKVESYASGCGGTGCTFGYNIGLYYVADTNFNEDDDLFAEIKFASTAKSSDGVDWNDVDLIVCVPPTTVNFNVKTDANQWGDTVDRSVLITIPEASIINSGTLLVDLGMKKSDLQSGIPIQVILRPNTSYAMGAFVNGNVKWQRTHIASVTIKGY